MCPTSYAIKRLKEAESLTSASGVSLKDSTFIVHLRKVVSMLNSRIETERNYQEINNMAGWVWGKLGEYQAPLPYYEGLETFYKEALRGYELYYVGLCEISQFFEDGNASHLQRGLGVAEEGEELLKEMEHRIKSEREWFCREIPYAVA